MITLERTVAPILVLVVLLVATSCGRDETGDASKQRSEPPVLVAAEEWVPTACTYLADVQEAVSGIFDGIDVTDVESRDGRVALRDELHDLLAGRRDRLQDIADRFEPAGAPDTRGGLVLRDAMLRGLTRTIERFDRMANRVSGVDVGALDGFQAGLNTSIGELEQAMVDMGEAREALFGDPSLTETIRDVPVCADL